MRHRPDVLFSLTTISTANAWLDKAIPNQPVTMFFKHLPNAESTRDRFRLQAIDLYNEVPIPMTAEAMQQEKARQATTGVDAKRAGRVRVPLRNMVLHRTVQLSAC